MAQPSSSVFPPRFGVMNPHLYNAVIKNEVDNFKGMGEESRDQRTINNETVLHLASMFGHLQMVKTILDVHDLCLVRKTNNQGNTPLHLAARGGHDDVVAILLQQAKSLPDIKKESVLQTTNNLFKKEPLLQTTNNLLDTALHLAVCGNHKNVVQLLVQEDPHHQYEKNVRDQTPLFLASLRGFTDIVEIILNNCESPSFDGPGEKTALHAAIMYGDSTNGHEIVKLLLSKHKDLVDQKDGAGKTALHLVAINNFPLIIDDLVRAKSCVGYLKDDIGVTALHIAAFKGHLDVMKKLLQHYPDMWNIRDSVDYGMLDMHRNILHIAIMANQKQVIAFILLMQGSKELLIQEDRCGDTPLHYIARHGCYVEEVMNMGELDWKMVNLMNISPLDILFDGIGKVIADQELIRTTLNLNADFWGSGREPVLRNHNYAMKEERHKKEVERIKITIGNHMVVAALIVTVSLTAGFAMPGGFNGNEGSTQGYAVLGKKPAFKVFMLGDTFALFFSLCSLSLYFMSTLQIDVPRTRRSFFFAMVFNLISLIALVVAFIAATYSVLIKPSKLLAIILCCIGSIVVVTIIVLVILLAVPYKWYKVGYAHKWKRSNNVQRLLC